jgi:dUTP pyrophosphatase
MTPNGFDLTVKEVHSFTTAGALDFSNKQRQLPECRLVEPRKRDAEDEFGWWELAPGAYKVVTNEVVTLPNDLIGMAFPRSSLLRMGAGTQTGVWDAGFSGTSEFLLTVFNPKGVALKQNAAWCSSFLPG